MKLKDVDVAINFSVQFQCVQGRIILVNENMTAQGDFLAKFVGISSSHEFVAKWNELTGVEAFPATTSSEATKSVTPPMATRTGASVASRGVLSYDHPSPSKKRKRMTNALHIVKKSPYHWCSALQLSCPLDTFKSRYTLRPPVATHAEHAESTLEPDSQQPGCTSLTLEAFT